MQLLQGNKIIALETMTYKWAKEVGGVTLCFNNAWLLLGTGGGVIKEKLATGAF